MTLVSISNRFYWPFGGVNGSYGNPATNSIVNLNAATDKYCMYGRIYIDGRPTIAKTLSTGTIEWRTAAVTFASGSTTIDIGIQDVTTGAGPIAQPDGGFDVKTTLTGGGGGITANAWQTTTMTSGSKSITHGDLIAVVWEIVTFGGADSIIISNNQQPLWSTPGQPGTNTFDVGAWQTTQTLGAGRWPLLIITFDDGTKAIIDSAFPATTVNSETFQDSSNPDERGMIFQVPFNCMMDCIWASLSVTDANSDFTLKVYRDATGLWNGSETSVTTLNVLAQQWGLVSASAPKFTTFPLATEFSIDKNIDYAVTVRATGSSNTILAAAQLANTAHRVVIPGGTTLKKLSRQNDAGAFTIESPATTMDIVGIGISQVDDGTGSGMLFAANVGIEGSAESVY